MDKYYVIDYIDIFLRINLFLVSPIFFIFLFTSGIIGIAEYYKEKDACRNNYRYCGTYKKYCYKETDVYFGSSEVMETRTKEIQICCDNNIYMSSFVWNSIYDYLYNVLVFYYYAIIIYTICFYGYYLINWTFYKIKRTSKEVINKINKEIPIVEEV